MSDQLHAIRSTAAESTARGNARHFIYVSGRRMGKSYAMAQAFGPVMSRADYDEQLHQSMVRARYRCECCNGSGEQLAMHASTCAHGPRSVTCPQCNGTGVDHSRDPLMRTWRIEGKVT